MHLKDQFDADGVVVVRGVLDASRLHALEAAVDENLREPGPWANDYTPDGASGRFFGDYVNWQRIDGYRAAATSGPLPRLAAELLGVEHPRFFHEHVLVKEAGTAEITPWHHDDPYYCVDGEQNVSLWVALDPVPEDAALEFIAGSHRWDRRFVPRKFVDHAPYAAADHGFELVPDVGELGRHRIVRTPVEPGDVVAFHFRTLHGAPGSSSRRRAVSLRYVGDDARFATRPWLHSPPFDDVRVGEPLDDERFPVV